MLTTRPHTAPRVSIVIPAYQCANTIPHVISAALQQTVQPVQVIVVNDRSPDALDEAVQPFLDRIVYISNEQNLGLARSCNRGLQRADADYVMTLHSDCILDRDYVEKLIQHMERDPTLGAATGQYLFSEPASLSLSDRMFALLNLLPLETDRRDQALNFLPFIEGKADVFRRSTLQELNYFTENLKLTSEDQDLSARMRQRGYRLLQDTSCRFQVMFTGTSDALWKVLRKQRTYARGQAYVALRYGRAILGETTTDNRRARARHRLSQLVFATVLLLALPVACWQPAWAWFIPSWIVLRILTYRQLATPFSRKDKLLARLLGPVADVLYWIGALEGTVKTLLFRST